MKYEWAQLAKHRKNTAKQISQGTQGMVFTLAYIATITLRTFVSNICLFTSSVMTFTKFLSEQLQLSSSSASMASDYLLKRIVFQFVMLVMLSEYSFKIQSQLFLSLLSLFIQSYTNSESCPKHNLLSLRNELICSISLMQTVQHLCREDDPSPSYTVFLSGPHCSQTDLRHLLHWCSCLTSNWNLTLQISQLLLSPLQFGRTNRTSILWLIIMCFMIIHCQHYNQGRKMSKTIFAVKPLSRQVQGGKVMYGIELITTESQRTQQVWKTLDEYCKLQKQISGIAFDFDCILQKQLQKAPSDEERLKLIIQFLNECKTRPDIASLLSFRSFFGLTEYDFEYLEEFDRVNVNVKDMTVVDIAWDSNMSMLITLHKPTNNVKKITNFFKELLSKETQLGSIRLYQQTQKWKMLNQTIPQAEPMHLQWSSKSGMLFLSTGIGIYIYTITKQAEMFKQQLIDFVKSYEVKDFKYGAKTGHLFYATHEKLYVHSISKQVTMEINPNPFPGITAITLEKSQSRLYTAESQAIRVFDVTDTKSIKQLVIIQNTTNFIKLVTSADKYLFGVSKLGFISVFEIRPPGKERLMDTLTNIDCPSNTQMFAFNEHNQMIITSNGQYIVIVSTKNIPLFAGGAHKQPITAGLFDNDSNIVVTADQESNVIFYNLSMRGIE